MIEPIIPFKVKTLPLPDNIGFNSSHFPYGAAKDSILNDLYNKTQNKIWTVAGIKSNPRYSPRIGEEPVYLIVQKSGVPRELPCNLLLLVREGETPIWWPHICCEVIETLK